MKTRLRSIQFPEHKAVCVLTISTKNTNPPERVEVFKVEMVEIESTSELGITDESTVCSLSFGLKSLSIE